MRAADVRARQAAAMSEDELAADVVALADAYGLWAFHDNDSRRNRAGLPDWLLVGTRVLWRELKSEKGRLRQSQEDVLARLTAAGEDAAVWRPSDLLSGAITAQIRSVSPRAATTPATTRGLIHDRTRGVRP